MWMKSQWNYACDFIKMIGWPGQKYLALLSAKVEYTQISLLGLMEQGHSMHKSTLHIIITSVINYVIFFFFCISFHVF